MIAAGAVLGGVLVVAGVTKIAAGTAWPAQAAAMGTPRWLARIVPWVEIAVGAAVAVRLAVQWATLAAMAMLVAFSMLILHRLAQGDRPPCACFGAWSARPLSWVDLARNGGLLILGAVVLVG